MISLPLPAGVERQVVQTSRGPVPVLCGQPQEPQGNQIDVVMVSGFFGTKEDFRELLSLLAAAGLRGWACDYAGQLDPGHGQAPTRSPGWPVICVELMRRGQRRPAVHVIGHCLGGFVARSAALAEPGLARSLTLLACGPSMRERKHRAMLSGLSQLHAKGGTMALWPLVKTLLAEDDTIMREFWHAKLATMNPRWVPAPRSRWPPSRTAAPSWPRLAFPPWSCTASATAACGRPTPTRTWPAASAPVT